MVVEDIAVEEETVDWFCDHVLVDGWIGMAELVVLGRPAAEELAIDGVDVEADSEVDDITVEPAEVEEEEIANDPLDKVCDEGVFRSLVDVPTSVVGRGAAGALVLEAGCPRVDVFGASSNLQIFDAISESSATSINCPLKLMRRKPTTVPRDVPPPPPLAWCSDSSDGKAASFGPTTLSSEPGTGVEAFAISMEGPQ
jgi:hypothetical protein